jgi:hypothetical protein
MMRKWVTVLVAPLWILGPLAIAGCGSGGSKSPGVTVTGNVLDRSPKAPGGANKK